MLFSPCTAVDMINIDKAAFPKFHGTINLHKKGQFFSKKVIAIFR